MESVVPTQAVCSFCSSPVDPTAFFCPICGKNLKNKPLSTGIFTQVGLYLVSMLLPPLFLGWTIKYIKSADPKTKQIGMISLALTIIALVFGVWFSYVFIKNITQQVNQQLIQYENIGL